MTAERTKQIALLHARFIGDCSCSVCRGTLTRSAGAFSLFALGKSASNALSGPRRVPPLAPYGAKPGTRIGGYHTRIFRFPVVMLDEQREEVAA